MKTVFAIEIVQPLENLVFAGSIVLRLACLVCGCIIRSDALLHFHEVGQRRPDSESLEYFSQYPLPECAKFSRVHVDRLIERGLR